MLVRAVVSFSGLISMRVGEQRELDSPIVEDLLKSGHVIEVKATDVKPAAAEKKERKGSKK
jgi:hypothetical protein